MTRRPAHFALALLLAGCATTPPRIAAPPPKRSAAPPVVLAPPRPSPADWRDQAETPGGWRYVRDAAGSAARFGANGAAPAFELRCDAKAHTVTLSRPGTTAGTLTVTTSYGATSWPAGILPGGRIAVILRAADPFLDTLAFSRGRFEVSGSGLAPLILPAWAEPARVIEDCRG